MGVCPHWDVCWCVCDWSLTFVLLTVCFTHFSAQINQNHGKYSRIGKKVIHYLWVTDPTVITPERGNASTTNKHLTSQQVMTAAHQSQSEPTQWITEWAQWWTVPIPNKDTCCDRVGSLWIQFDLVNTNPDTSNRTLCDDTKTHSFPSQRCNLTCWSQLSFYYTHLPNYQSFLTRIDDTNYKHLST